MALAADAELRDVEWRDHTTFVPTFAVEDIEISRAVAVDENWVVIAHRQRVAVVSDWVDSQPDRAVRLAQRKVIAQLDLEDALWLAGVGRAVRQQVALPKPAGNDGSGPTQADPFDEFAPRKTRKRVVLFHARFPPESVSIAIDRQDNIIANRFQADPLDAAIAGIINNMREKRTSG